MRHIWVVPVAPIVSLVFPIAACARLRAIVAVLAVQLLRHGIPPDVLLPGTAFTARLVRLWLHFALLALLAA